jgi:hypothetical protein
VCDRPTTNVLQHFFVVGQSVGHFAPSDDHASEDILLEDSYVELSIDVSTSSKLELSDQEIVEHFTNQSGQLVCRVCYKIFPSGSDVQTFRCVKAGLYAQQKFRLTTDPRKKFF